MRTAGDRPDDGDERSLFRYGVAKWTRYMTRPPWGHLDSVSTNCLILINQLSAFIFRLFVTRHSGFVIKIPDQHQSATPAVFSVDRSAFDPYHYRFPLYK